MTVIRPNSVSGITSITAQANEINVFRSNGLLAGLNLNGVNFNTTAGISTLAALKVTGNLDVEGVLTYQDVTNVDSVGIITARDGLRVTGIATIGGNVLPATDNSHDLGSTSKRWANVHVGDMKLSNEGSSNDVDGSWGSYVIQEGENDLFLINNRNGKKYKFNLTEVN